MNIFSQRLKEIRKQKNLTQENLAEVLNVSSQAVSKWECGTSYPDLEVLSKISNCLNVSIDYMLGVDKPQKEENLHSTLDEVRNLKQEGELEQAITLINNSLIKYPKEECLLIELANCLCDTNSKENIDDAIDYYINLTNSSSLMIKISALIGLCKCYNYNEKYESAVASALMLPNMDSCSEINLIKYGNEKGFNNLFLPKCLKKLTDNLKLVLEKINEFTFDFNEEHLIPITKNDFIKIFNDLELTILEYKKKLK